MTLMQQMCRHGRSRGLPMCSGHTKAFMRMRQPTQDLRPFFHLESMRMKIDQLLMIFRYGRCIYHQTRRLVPARLRNQSYILLIMNQGTFFRKFLRKFGRRSVISSHHNAGMQEKAGDGTHSNPPYSHKVYGFNLIQLHDFIFFCPCMRRLIYIPLLQYGRQSRKTPSS